MMAPKTTLVFPVLKSAAALLLLNSLLSFENWWPTPGITLDSRLAPEFVGFWLLLLLLVGLRPRPSSRVLAGLAVAYLTLVIGRYADVTVPALFGRSLNLYWDGHQVPIVLSVLARKVSWWIPAVIVLTTVLSLWGVYRLIRWAIETTVEGAIPRALGSPVAWTFTACAAVLVGFNLAGEKATWPWVSKPVIPVYARQANLLVTALVPGRQDAALPPSPTFDSDLGVLKGADVSIFFLESYGATTLDNPANRRALASSRERFERALAESGQSVFSALVRSPTFGGGSELAHLGLLSGLDLSDPFRHDLLLTTARPTLVSFFCARGYQSHGLYSALTWDWAEKSYYGYDVFVDARDLNYPGPQFGSWLVPDQYTIARFEQMYPIRADSPPRFVFFATISSHIPFAPAPPYQSDWNKLLSGEPFAEAAVAQALKSEPKWLDLTPDFLRTINYTFDWLADYVRQPRPRDRVLILLGDHQPASSVSGRDAPWDVPVHVITSNPELSNRLRAAGLQRGLEPQRPILGEMHEFTQTLLDVFDSRRCQGGDEPCGRKPRAGILEPKTLRLPSTRTTPERPQSDSQDFFANIEY